jgi:DnaK suppressor protein
MTPEQKQELKAVIEKKIYQTENSITEYREMTQPVAPDDSIGRLSRMDAINNKSVMEAALRQAEQKLSRLKESLFKIQDSEYGKCTKCGSPIPFNRLKAIPDSTRCIGCA